MKLHRHRPVSCCFDRILRSLAILLLTIPLAGQWAVGGGTSLDQANPGPSVAEPSAFVNKVDSGATASRASRADYGLTDPCNRCFLFTFSALTAGESAGAGGQSQPDASAEAEWDRVEALAHFSAARHYEHSGQLELALRRYQRAVRYDPESSAAFQAAVGLALRLNRLEEAARMIRTYGRPGVLEIQQLLTVGLFLIQRGQYADAAKVLELAVADQSTSTPRLARVALRLELGRLCYLTGQYEQAAGHFRFVLNALQEKSSQPLSPQERQSLLRQPLVTWRLMGSTFLEVKEYDRAEFCFRQAFAAEGNRALLSYDLARLHKSKGEWAAAEQAILDYLQDPRDAEGLAPYHLLAEILKQQGREDQLLSKLSEAHSRRPENLPLTFALAEEYFRLGRREEAAQLAEQVLQSRSVQEAWELLLRIHKQAQDWPKLLSLLGRMQEEGIALETLSTEERSDLATPEVCKQLLEVLQTETEGDVNALLARKAALAELALEAQDLSTARALTEELLTAGSKHTLGVLLELAFAYAEKKQYTESCDLLQKALERTRDPAEKAILHYYLAGFLELTGQTDEALAAAQQAAEGSRENPRFKLRLGWINLHAKRQDAAAAAYRELVERWDADHSSADIRQAVREAKLALSSLAAEQERFDEAVEWLEQVLDEFPEDPSALNDLGYLWADRNMRLHRALKMIQKALEAEPESAAYRDSLGWVLFRLGKFEEAVKELKQAAESEPDPVIWDHYGDALNAAGRQAEAVEAWQRAVELFLQQNDTRRAEKVKEKVESLQKK